MRNEKKYIRQCLESILGTEYPKDLLEVIVIDGMSTDGSRNIVMEYCAEYPMIKILDNPGKIIPKALNIGWKAAKGQIIIRMDAHALYSPDYIPRCVELLQTTPAKNVGGRQRPMGVTFKEKAIAIALSSRFGIGNVAYKFKKECAYVDTVYLGAWWKKTLEDLDGFNERWWVNEDYELNYRLRQKGEKILLSPDILSQYYVRGSLRRLFVQQFRYGFWRYKTIRKHPGSLTWRYLIPPIFFVGVVISLLVGFFVDSKAFVFPLLYLIANMIASIFLSLKNGLAYLFILPLIFVIIHGAWGAGFITGTFRWGIGTYPDKRNKNHFAEGCHEE